MNRLKALLYVVLAAVCWATVPLFTRYLYNSGVTPAAVISWRAIFSAGFAWVYFAVSRQGHAALPLRQIGFYALYGFVGVTALFLCYLGSLCFVSIPMSTAMLNTAPAFVVLMCGLFFRERINRLQLLAVAMVLGGCVLVVEAYSPDAWQLNAIGIALGMGAGVSYAGLSVLGRFALQKQPAGKSLTWMLTFGALFIFVFVRPGDMLDGLTVWWQWLLLAGLALISTVLANAFYLRGVHGLGAPLASLVVVLEPVLSVLLSVVLFGEGLSLWQGLGMALVLGGVVLPVLLDGRRRPVPRPDGG